MKRSKSADPAHDVLGYEPQRLDAIFRPETVAVIGATERPGSVGRTIMWNLVSSPFGGTVFPVNSHRPERTRHKGLPFGLRGASQGGPRGHRGPRARGARDHPRVRGGWGRGRHHHLGWFQGDGPRGCRAGGTGPRGGQAGQDADRRPQLPRAS